MTNDDLSRMARECSLSRFLQVEKTIVIKALAEFTEKVIAGDRQTIIAICDAQESYYWNQACEAEEARMMERYDRFMAMHSTAIFIKEQIEARGKT